jgi:subtilase family serine protease
MARSTRLRLSAGLVAGLAIAAIPIAASAAGASTSAGPNSLVKVQQGTNPTAIPGTTVFGTTPSDTPETVSFILKANDLASLEAKVIGGGFNASNFLSVTQFADTYGQGKVAAELSSYLARYGITTTTYRDTLDISATGTAGEFDSALSTSQKQYQVPELKGKDGGKSIPAQTIHAPSTSPELPRYLGNSVLAVLGLSNYSDEFTNDLTRAPATGAKPASGDNDDSKDDSASACETLTGLPGACNLPSDFEKEYGLSSVEGKADGAGQTIGIVTLASVDRGAPEYFWKNVAGINKTGTVSVDNIDGGPGTPTYASGSGETDLDVEQSGAVAPAANVVVYQAPNTDPGFADAFYTAASQNVASTVSASWGESETIIQAAVDAGEETSGYVAAFDEAYLEFAAQGQSAFTSSADEGAYTATADLGTTNLSVDNPADSPYITAAGGTTNPWSATLTSSTGASASVDVKNQRAWGWDYLWPAIATLNGASYATAATADIAGDGGGYSVAEARPSYQDKVPGISSYNAVANLTPTDPEAITGGLVEPTSFTVNENPSVVSGTDRTGRVVPDVSTDADPESGYLEWSPAFVQGGISTSDLMGGWGGTSFVAPQLNGSTAEIDSYLGHRVGFWNPAVYSFATSGHDPFTPLNAIGGTNDNLYYTGNGAGSLYNPGSGLGTPNLSALAADFKASRQ